MAVRADRQLGQHAVLHLPARASARYLGIMCAQGLVPSSRRVLPATADEPINTGVTVRLAGVRGTGKSGVVRRGSLAFSQLEHRTRLKRAGDSTPRGAFRATIAGGIIPDQGTL